MPRRRHKVSPIHKCWRSAGTGGRGDKEKGGQRRERRRERHGREGSREGSGRGVRERGEEEGRGSGGRKGRMELPFGRLSRAVNFCHLVSANSTCTRPPSFFNIVIVFDHSTFNIQH